MRAEREEKGSKDSKNLSTSYLEAPYPVKLSLNLNQKTSHLTCDLEAAPGVDLEEEVAADEGEDLDGVLEDVLGGVAAGRPRGLGQDEERGALRVRVRAPTDALHQQVGVDHARKIRILK